jgi:hypothetical protein
MPKRVLAFGEAASTIRNNLIADLLFLSKCHAPTQSLLGLGPRPWIFAPALCFLKPPQPQVQARKRGRVPYSHRLWSLARHCMALRGAEGTQEGSGRTSGGALKKKIEKRRRDFKKKNRGKCCSYNFFGIPDYTEGLFVCSNHALQENTI